MDLTLCGDPADFLDLHRGKIALNVKVHEQYSLSKPVLEALAKLNQLQRERVLEFAESNVRENWWASMRELAQELDLGDAFPEGRSGGWLVFNMTYAQLEELIAEAERECKHCREAYAHHIAGKCPFQATEFLSAATRPFVTWEALRKFSAAVKASLSLISKDLDTEVQFLLEHLDDEFSSVVAFPGQGASGNEDPFEEEGGDEGSA